MRIFLDDDDHRRFVHLLGEVVEEFGIECWNYCLMPNHYHVTLLPSLSNLSEAIKRLNSVYAQWWNKRHDRVGHVFQGRFKDQIVQHETYLLALSRYVVMNPIRAGLVEHPEDWCWSSYRATVGLSPCPSFLCVSRTLRLFGDSDEESVRTRFSQYVTGEPEAEATMDRIRSCERILGTRAYKAAVMAFRREESEISQYKTDVIGGSVVTSPE
jgi:REP element-mobilizing transposase RayT